MFKKISAIVISLLAAFSSLSVSAAMPEMPERPTPTPPSPPEPEMYPTSIISTGNVLIIVGIIVLAVAVFTAVLLYKRKKKI